MVSDGIEKSRKEANVAQATAGTGCGDCQSMYVCPSVGIWNSYRIAIVPRKLTEIRSFSESKTEGKSGMRPTKMK